MAFDPGQFRAQLQGDGARPNLFEIQMPFPALISPGNAQQKLTFMARASSLPGISMGITPVFYFGREIKLAGNTTFADWSITVLNDTDFVVRNAFERWRAGINGHSSNKRIAGFRNLAGYSVNPIVKQFDMEGNVVKTYEFQNVWPNDISPIDLDWSANDSVEEFTVNLVVQSWSDAANGIT
jgi:hypothetical protein